MKESLSILFGEVNNQHLPVQTGVSFVPMNSYTCEYIAPAQKYQTQELHDHTGTTPLPKAMKEHPKMGK